MQLFDPIVDENSLHPNFRNIIAGQNGFDLDVLTDWAAGFVDRDGKFVKEFQTTFNSSFWELYLFAVLKKYGMRVDFSKKSPDFFIPDLGFNIEATIASHARDGQPEHGRHAVEVPKDLNPFNLYSIIRLSNSLTSKHKKYIESYSRLDHVSERPFVVAIASFDQPYGFMECNRPIEAVLHSYYVDEECYIAADYGERRPLTGELLSQVQKDNGSPIELGMFSTPRYKEISAVIFSACATWGKVRALSSDPKSRAIFTALKFNPASPLPHVIRSTKKNYEENLIDGLRIYHNPYAEYPIDPDIFRHPSVFQSYYRNNDWIYEQREGQLLCRFLISSRVRPAE